MERETVTEVEGPHVGESYGVGHGCVTRSTIVCLRDPATGDLAATVRVLADDDGHALVRDLVVGSGYRRTDVREEALEAAVEYARGSGASSLLVDEGTTRSARRRAAAEPERPPDGSPAVGD